MLYPNLPDYSELRPEELQRFYRELLVYTDELKFGDDINPQSVEVDFDTNTITINF